MKSSKSRISLGKFATLWLLSFLTISSSSLDAQEIRSSDNESSAAPVGEVSLVIGKAFIESESRRVVRVKNGDFVREGDSIRTESSGHVHIRFVDDAVLSVRPLSELEIIAYRFDQADPGNTLVKLSLSKNRPHGLWRAAKTARDRFRLNTPIAAIGVRGTDLWSQLLLIPLRRSLMMALSLLLPILLNVCRAAPAPAKPTVLSWVVNRCKFLNLTLI